MREFGPAILGACLLCVPTAANALDQREGQHWRCVGGPVQIEYVIGKLEAVSAILPDLPAERDVRLAHLSVWEATELGPGRQIDHMPFQANRVTCAGQVYVGEGLAIPDGFEAGYASWRAAAASGQAGWFAAPIDEMFRAVRILPAPEETRP